MTEKRLKVEKLEDRGDSVDSSNVWTPNWCVHANLAFEMSLIVFRCANVVYVSLWKTEIEIGTPATLGMLDSILSTRC